MMQHHQVRAVLVAQAVVSCTSPASAGAQESQMQALARDVDAQVLSAGREPTARSAAILAYVELLLREALEDLRVDASAAGITVASLSQAEDALRTCVLQLKRALVGRLRAPAADAAAVAAAGSCGDSGDATQEKARPPGATPGAAAAG